MADSEDAGPRGRCVSCGFVSWYVGEWKEVTQRDRREGIYTLLHQAPLRSGPSLRCFMHVADLDADAQQNLANLQEAGDTRATTTLLIEGTLAVLNLDRHCSRWYLYTPGLNPKEHRDEMVMMQLENDRRKHDLELAKLHVGAEQQSQAIAAALKATTEATARFTTKWTYVAVAIAVLALVFVAANYFLPDLGRQIGHSLFPNLSTTLSPTVSATP